MRCLKTIIFLIVLFLAVESQAIEMTFPGFLDSSNLTLNGVTAVVTTDDGMILRLTPAQRGQSGSAFSTETVNAAKFSTFFKFRITEPGGNIYDCNTEAGADGLVFVIQSVASDIGGGGYGIGYNGIETSIGVEFDTWCNGANHDPNSNHLGIDINGSVNHGEDAPDTLVVEPNFDDGNIWYVWIDYNGTTLEIRTSQHTSRPSQVLLQKEVDIPGLLGQDAAFIGFTSGTGADWGNHDILYWEYRDDYDPIVVVPDCEEEYHAGVEAGRQQCIDDPASCGIMVGGDYQQGYQDGLAACPEGTSALISDALDIYIPDAVYKTILGDFKLWVDLEYLGDLTWELRGVDIK